MCATPGQAAACDAEIAACAAVQECANLAGAGVNTATCATQTQCATLMACSRAAEVSTVCPAEWQQCADATGCMDELLSVLGMASPPTDMSALPSALSAACDPCSTEECLYTMHPTHGFRLTVLPSQCSHRGAHIHSTTTAPPLQDC